MAICELVAEPEVRKAVREPFLKRALVSTEPTPQGEQLLDPFHVCGRVKRLRDKPVQSFAGSDTFLRIAQAEKEGLIEVRIDINAQVLEDLIQDMSKLYQSPQQTRIAKAWNAIRADTLRRAIMERLLPSFAVELRSKLLAEAQEAVLLQVSDKLWDWASQAPTQVQTGDESTVVEHRRFAAVCWGPGDPATTMVMLNEHGQLVDVLYAGQLSGSIRRTRRNAQGVDDIFSDPAKSKDAERIRDFLVQHTPHKIFLGGACMQCVQLYEDLQKVLDHMLDRMPSAFTRTETGYIELNWADESLAALWETSESAKQEMGDQLPLVRRAIALARCKLEPLAVLSALCGPSAEILSMDLHPLKELVPRQALLKAAERICITAVNQVGLDVNVVAHSAWLAAPLQFVAGLGPRKSQLLSRAVQREEFVQTRSDLYKGLGVLGKHVFRNCGGPLLITASSDEVSLEDLDPLDATRITPVLYVYAKGLARAIVDPGAEEEAGKHHVREAQSRPNDVEGFNLLEYSKELQEAEGRDHLTTLRDVAFELAAPGAELRRQRDTFKVTEVLYMLCGESAETLKEGREVSAVVTFAGSRDVLVRLPDFGDAEGVISEVASDYGNPVQPRDRFVRDQAIRVRVNSLVASESSSNISKLSVVLVDEEDMDSNDIWEERYCRDIEPWYHILTREERQKARDEKKRALKSRQLINRPIRHPYFKNLSALQTAEALRDADVGACLFTPSTRGTDQITLTMKVHKRTDDGLISDIYLSKEVKEGPKGSAVGAHLKLGKPLEITFLGAKGGSEHYEDLDEILARFVEPYVAQLKQIKGHRKYREGPAKHVEAQLKQEKKQMGTKGAAYVLGAKQESPGVFYVAYIANVTPHREYMSVTPDGIYFRSEVRKNIEHVLYLFKKNPAGERASMQAEPQAPPPPAAPRVNRFSAQPPAAPPGGPPVMPAARPGAVQPIKPAWLTASQPQQVQQPQWAQPQPVPAGNEWGSAQSAPGGNAWAPAQPGPAGNAWAPAPPAPANGYPHNAPPPPPQLPAPGYSQAYGRR